MLCPAPHSSAFIASPSMGLAAIAACQCLEPAVQPTLCGRGKRTRRVGIVALARRLAIALWRYLEHGEIPNGVVLKPTTA